MIGRGAIGDYDIFKRIEAFFNEDRLLAPASISKRINWLKKHVMASVSFYGEQKGLVILRKIIPYYIKDIPNASQIRNQFNKFTTLKEFNDLFAKFKF